MRFIHTADWQLGFKAGFCAPESAARLRAFRFQTLRAIAELAKARNVDAVLVPGDVIDDNGVGLDVIQQTDDALRLFAPIKVVLMPGNHDAATADSALRRLARADHIIIADRPEVIEIAGAAIYPCPLLQRHTMADTTAWIPPAEPGETMIRIGMAHGPITDFAALSGRDSKSANLLDINRMLAKGLDYIALGDWHGTLSYHQRAWYSGAHEPTNFKENGQGNVLVVEIDAPGSVPKVEDVAVAATKWLKLNKDFAEDKQVDELAAELEAIPERSATLLQLTLSGTLSIGAKARLENLLQGYDQRFALLRVNDEGVRPEPSDEELNSFKADGIIGDVAADLRQSKDVAARDALVLLNRLLQAEPA